MPMMIGSVGLLALAACRIDIELVRFDDDTGAYAPPLDGTTGTTGATADGGICYPGFLQVGLRHDTRLSPSASAAKLQEWQITGGILADDLGSADADRDVLSALTCGPRCGADGEIDLSTGDDPFLKDIGRVGLHVGTPGTGLVLATCDLDGDGVDEVAQTDVSATDDLLNVFWRGDLLGVPTVVRAPGAGGSAFGVDLACGDFVGDERNDLVVASTERFTFYAAGPGDRELSATSGPPLPDVPTAMSDVGDADGDGAPDLAYVAVGRGLLRWHGATGIPLASFVGDLVPELAGDVNGDGLDDLLVTSRVGTSASVSLLLGAAGEPWSEPAWTVDLGPTALPPRAVGLSDLDGDGYGEVAISTVTDGDLAGQFTVYGGAGVDSAPLFTCRGASGEELGVGMANAGDLDGDGRDELIVTRRVVGASTMMDIWTRSGTE